jgi:hypothetical protein
VSQNVLCGSCAWARVRLMPHKLPFLASLLRESESTSKPILWVYICYVTYRLIYHIPRIFLTSNSFISLTRISSPCLFVCPSNRLLLFLRNLLAWNIKWILIPGNKVSLYEYPTFFSTGNSPSYYTESF